MNIADRTCCQPILIAALLLMATVISACSTTADTKQKMSAEQIKSQLITKSLRYKLGAEAGTITYRSNGKLSYTAAGKPFSGTWRLQGNQMCTFLDNGSRGQKETCFNWFNTGAGTYKTGLGYEVRVL